MNSATSDVSVAVRRSAPSSSLNRTSLPGIGGSNGNRLAPPRPTTKYVVSLRSMRSYEWWWPLSTMSAPHSPKGHCMSGVDPYVDPLEYAG